MTMQLGFFEEERDSKRRLSEREKKILFERAKGKCEICGKKISYLEMQQGHNRAWSKGGATTLKNSVCLCYKCNTLQGTRTKKQLLKDLGKKDPSAELKQNLKSLNISQLKSLAKKYNVKIRGKTEDMGLFGSKKIAPTKNQYINKLAKIVSDSDIKKAKVAKPIKKKKKKTIQ